LQNLAAGPITFRFYHAENQYLYEKTTALQFKPGTAAGNAAGPYPIEFAPLVPTLDAGGTVQITVSDPTWLGNFPVDFIVKDCQFPNTRRDTASAVFSVTNDNRPHLGSPPAVSFRENACSALYDAQATDPADSEGAGLSYSIAGGADAGKFAIDATSGQLSWFNFSPDFENPADDNTDNVYEVLIRVTNTLSLFDELALAVTVTDQLTEPFQALLNGGAPNVCMTGSAVLQASGGSAYLWSTGSTNTSITVNTAGIYTVTVTSDGGCTASATVTVSSRPTIAAAGSSAPVCAGSNISLNSTVSGGSGVYTAFSWAGPNGFNAPVEDPAPFAATPAAAGVYTVTVTDEGGCTATATTSIAVSGNSAPAVAATNNGPLCAGFTLSLGAAPSGGSGVYSSYKWSGPNGFGSMLQMPPGFTAIAAAAGVYTVTVTDNAGCTATGTTAVQVKPLPAIDVSSNSPVCTGGTVLLNSTPSGGSGNSYVFTWSGPNSFASAAEDPAGIPALAAAGGIYTVSVTDGGGCTASATATVAVKGLPAITAALLSPVCAGGNIRLASAPTGGSTPYAQFSWSGPDNFNAQAEDPAPFPAVPAAAGVYTVTVTDQAACTATGSVSVTVHPVPAIVALGTGSVCQGGSLTLASTPSGGTAPYMLFNWTGPDNYVASVEDPAAFNVTPASAGIYQVKVTDSKGCTGTATTTVAVNMKPTVTATSNSPVCTGSNIDLQANSTGGSGVYATFSWLGPDGFMSMQQNPAGFPATQLKTGTYRLTVTDNAGCTATASTSVAVSTNIAPSITASGAGPACAGGGNIVLGSAPSGGTTPYTGFAWSGPGNYAASQQNPPAFAATGSASGVYTVTVTDSKGCAGTSSVSVQVGAITVSPSTNTPLCTGTTVYLSANPAGSAGMYISFSWTGPNGYMASVENPPGFPATANVAGVYTVTVTDDRGCSGTGTVNVSLESNDAPTIDCPADQTVAADGDCTVALGSWVSFAANLSDDCTAPGNITVTQAPLASILLSGHDDENTVTLTADDGAGNSTSCSFRVTLKDITPPSISCPPDQTVASGAGCSASLGNWVSFAANLNDNCKAPGEIAVTQAPLASTLLSGHNDERTVTLVADDGNGNTTPCTFKVTLRDVAPPSITCPSDKTVAADAGCTGLTGDWVSSATNVSDNCTASGSIQVTQLPVAGTLLSGHNDEETVTLTADDLHGNTTPCTFKVTLKDVTPPSITCPADQTVAADANCAGVAGDRTGMAGVADNCTAAANILVTQMPAANAPLSGHNAELTVTLTADDLHGNTASCSFKITLKDVTPPAITCPTNTTVSCAANVPGPNTGSVTASDNCSTPVKTFLYDTAPYDSACINRFRIDRYYRATDAVGNSNSCSQRITVHDDTPPSLLFVPANVTVQCNAIPNVGTPSGADNCAGNVAVTYNGQTVSNILCTDSYTITRQWTATDACGNTKTATQRITVQDTQRPLFTSVPANVTVECSAVPNVGTATATDNCDTNVTVSFDGESRTNGTCPDAYTLTRRWLAVDNCGNTRTATQRITVRDTQKPVFTTVPQNVTIQCTDPAPNVGSATATDNCDASVTVTYLGQNSTYSNCPN
ncbi:MAG: cadherin repeat domain-containing protein, partial [Thermoanaerobaculia bacterium]|nr:cadherin repeat domain-containing protein [Thermoanaerobaculia bacterium]